MNDTTQVERTYNALTERFGPVGRTLSRLIRPTFVAPAGKVFVWADFSGIESRVLPWLADSDGAEDILDVFRENDADPSLPDNYIRQAAKILRKPESEVTKAERQSHGKIPTLALGFGGANGALAAMARAYGAFFTEAEETEIVVDWRDTNTWAVRFWDQVWDAFLWCKENPGDAREVGMLTFYFNPSYLGGTLFMVLPDGTWLSYPSLRWEERERKDKTTGEVYVRTQLTYRSGRARVGLWRGLVVNNAVQGTAACLLRHTLSTIDADGRYDVLLHTHDECLVCVDDAEGPAAAAYLVEVMSTPPEWAPGLPLAVEATIADYYTKTAEE